MPLTCFCKAWASPRIESPTVFSVAGVGWSTITFDLSPKYFKGVGVWKFDPAKHTATTCVESVVCPKKAREAQLCPSSVNTVVVIQSKSSKPSG